MMTKILVAGGLAAATGAFICIATLTTAGRSLASNELAMYSGGEQQFSNRCCDHIGLCDATGTCPDTTDPFLCYGNTEESAQAVNTKGCNSGVSGATCTEPCVKVACVIIYNCTVDPQTGECGRGAISDVRQSPDNCVDTGCP